MKGVDKLYYPGEIEANQREKRLKDGIYVEDETWNQIVDAAKNLGIDTSKDDLKPIG